MYTHMYIRERSGKRQCCRHSTTHGTEPLAIQSTTYIFTVARQGRDASHRSLLARSRHVSSVDTSQIYFERPYVCNVVRALHDRKGT